MGEKPALREVASECGYGDTTATAFSNSISSGSFHHMSIYYLETIVKTLKSYILTDDPSDVKFYEEVLNNLEESIEFRRTILEEFKKQVKYEYSYSKTQYNPGFKLQIDENGNILRIPNNLEVFEKYLELVYALEGGMPAQVQRYHRIFGLDKVLRVSSFSKGPYTTNMDNVEYPKLYKIFNNDIIIKGGSDLDKLHKLNEVARIAKILGMEQKYQTKNAGGPHHDWVIPASFDICEDIIVVSEVPIFYPDPSSGNLLTGHIDHVVIIGKNIYICDYKPDLNFDLNTNRIGSVFADSIPQVATYGLIFKLMFNDIFGFNEENGYNLFCYTYHKDNGADYIYKPETALKAYTEAYKILKKGDPIPWEFLLNI
ncbi:MAG: hypothetical protein GF311_20365 [Candidatus Lokiarchaeota archaeon]|nr:hypothetical protein [Candidatus Lokiarchaeota archaeon]